MVMLVNVFGMALWVFRPRWRSTMQGITMFALWAI